MKFPLQDLDSHNDSWRDQSHERKHRNTILRDALHKDNMLRWSVQKLVPGQKDVKPKSPDLENS